MKQMLKDLQLLTRADWLELISFTALALGSTLTTIWLFAEAYIANGKGF
jgi:hypothetical protein